MNKHEQCRRRGCVLARYVGPSGKVNVNGWSGELENGATFCIKKGEANAKFEIIVEPKPGLQLSNDFKSLGFDVCPQCSQLARKMDRHGVAWCRSNIDRIISQIIDNAQKKGVEVSGVLSRYGLKQIVLRSITISEGKEPTIVQESAFRVAKLKHKGK